MHSANVSYSLIYLLTALRLHSANVPYSLIYLLTALRLHSANVSYSLIYLLTALRLHSANAFLLTDLFNSFAPAQCKRFLTDLFIL
jgi:hypothetical protein